MQKPKATSSANMDLEKYSFVEKDGLKQHTCSLAQEPDVIDTYIYRGTAIAFRRKFRAIMTINSAHLLSKKVFKSASAINMEKARHLYHHYHMIHPFSLFRIIWEYVMTVTYLLQFIITPAVISFYDPVQGVIVFKYLLDLVCAVDIVLFFLTGYYDQVEQKVILEPSRVAFRYIITYFVFDVISTFPWMLVLQILYSTQFQGLLIRVFILLRLTRISTFMTYFSRIGEYLRFASHKFRKVNLVLMFMMYVYWTSCFLLLLSNMKDYTWMPEDLRYVPAYALLYSCYKALLSMFLISYGDIPTKNPIDILFYFVCLSLGLIFQMYMLAEILTIRNKSAISTDKYSHLIQQLEEYMKYKELPEHLRSRITVYFDFRFQKHVYKEDELLETLSPLLVKEILLYQCQNLVKRVDFFKDLPQSVTYILVQKLKSEIFLPNDIIVQANVTGQFMYFIFTGTVAVYTTTGKEVCHLTDGAHFGEISLVMNVVRTAYVVAVDACELFRLSRKDFQEAIGPFEDIMARIQKIAQDRFATIAK